MHIVQECASASVMYRFFSCVFHLVAYLGGARSSNSEGAGTRRRPPAREHCTGLPVDHAYYTAALQRVCNAQETLRVYSISLRVWAEPEDATQREQGHGG